MVNNVGPLMPANNLADVNSVSTSLTNLGFPPPATGAPGNALVVDPTGTKFGFNINRFQSFSVLDAMFFNQAQFNDVISGAPTLDVSSNLQAALNYCAANGYKAVIPESYMLLGSQITSTTQVCVESNEHGFLQWTSLASCGWSITGGPPGRPGYGHVELPQLVGPNNTSGYTGHVATNNYSLVGFTGTGLQLSDMFWAKIRIARMIGWGSAIKITSATQGARNLYIESGTIDLSNKGIHISPGAVSCGQSRFVTDNIFALFPAYFDSSVGSIFEYVIDSVALHVAEQTGYCVFHSGSNISDVRLGAKATNGYDPNDSPFGTPTTYKGPLIGGDQTGPGGEAGWAVGTRNHYEFHMDGTFPIAGNPILTKLRGPGGRVGIPDPLLSASGSLTAKALSQTQGEANYNGGVGGAAINRFSFVQAAVPIVSAGGTAVFYFYHQTLNPDSPAPIILAELRNSSPLQILMNNNSTTVAREVIITFANPTTTATTATTINFWIEVPN